MDSTAAAEDHSSQSATGRSGPVAVRLTVEGLHGRTGPVAEFSVSVRVNGPRGALAYRLAFGDGTSSSPVLPQVCRSTPGPARSETWLVHHRYPHAGTYRVVATGWAVCTAGRATAAAVVTAR